MRKFSGILVMFLIGATYVILFSMVSVAQQNTDAIQVTLKSKNLGLDPVWGGDKATITLTINKMGNLTYIEEYYGMDSYGQPNLYQAGRHEAVMSDYTITFDMNRPNKKHGLYWSLIKSKVMLDKVTVYETWINTSGTYRSFTGRSAWFNNSTIDVGKGRPAIQKRESFDPTVANATSQINDTENVTDNSTKVIVPEKASMLEVPLIIAILFAVYVFSHRKNRK
jgi:hypothetical protein